MASNDVVISIEDDRFRICGCPEEPAKRKVAVNFDVPTPTGSRPKSAEWGVEALTVALFLLDRGPLTGGRVKFVRNALGLSMHELAYVLGEADQQAVVAREKGDATMTMDLARKLKAFVIGAAPGEFRDRIRSMATRATHGENERIFFWV